MSSPAPERILLDGQALTLLERILKAASPEEGCALLLGVRAASEPAGPGLWHLGRVWPCRNGWLPRQERHRRFAIDPREQLHAQKWARSRGLEVLGTAHSHPSGPPVPSAVDRALAFPPALMLIRSGVLPLPEGLACWWLPEEGEPRALPWTMEP